MISTGDVKKGIVIELDGQLMKVLDWSHIKVARGSAQVRMKLQNVRRGDIVERTFQAGTRWPRARVEQRKVQYLYGDGEAFHFSITFLNPVILLGKDINVVNMRSHCWSPQVFIS